MGNDKQYWFPAKTMFGAGPSLRRAGLVGKLGARGDRNRDLEQPQGRAGSLLDGHPDCNRHTPGDLHDQGRAAPRALGKMSGCMKLLARSR